MKRSEFAELSEKSRKSVAIATAVFIVSLILCIIALGTFGGQNPELRNNFLANCAFVSLFLILILFFIYVSKHNLRCTKCNKTLGLIGVQLAITTGNCNRCSATFLED